MRKESMEFLEALLAACGPAGFEHEARKVWLAHTREWADRVDIDVHGNAIAILNPEAPFRVLLAGHLDEIGLLVKHIAAEGLLHVAAIGGVDAGVLPGSRVRVHARAGRIPGVIGKKPVHLQKADDRDKVAPIHELWIDIGAKNRKDAERHVAVGDAVTWEPNFTRLAGSRFASKACDNRVGAFVVAEALRRMRKAGVAVGVYAVGTAQEEVGLRGATTSGYAIDPQAAIAVDVTWASDTPDIDKRIVGEVALGKGPVLHAGANINPVLGAHLLAIARKRRIAHQFVGEPAGTGTDAWALQTLRAGIATAVLSIPNRYMHTPVEVCDTADLEAAAALLAAAVSTLAQLPSFAP